MASSAPADGGAPPTREEQATLDTAARRIASGFVAQALGDLRGLIAARPTLAPAWRLQGAALTQLGRLVEAEAALREAMRLAPSDEATRVDLSRLLVTAGRVDEALEVVSPCVSGEGASLVGLSAAGEALKAAGRLDEALQVYERARAVAPASAVAEHNVAGVLGDLQRYPEAAAAAQRAFDKGLDAPQTWLVRARALQGMGELDEAERSYREAIRRQPSYADALGDLAQLIWMRTADLAQAQAPLDEAIRAFPQGAPLRLKKAFLQEFAGDGQGAYRDLVASPASAQADWGLQVRAAQLSARFAPALALQHARAGLAKQPNEAVAMITLAQAQLAGGDATAAAETAAQVRERWPLDQHAIALQATAWRLMGDPRYGELYDYERLVRRHRIDTPNGWSSLDAFLAALAGSLTRLHRFRTHPLGQSVRGGSQTSESLINSDDPAIQAFFQAIDGPIRRHIAELGEGDDPLRRRRLAEIGR